MQVSWPQHHTRVPSQDQHPGRATLPRSRRRTAGNLQPETVCGGQLPQETLGGVRRPILTSRLGGSLALPPRSVRGFTLVELLVTMSIFVVISFLTIGAINFSLTGEQVRGSARQVQSKIEGARDRAIYNSKETVGQPRPVGVRLLVDPDIPTICRSMVYIESPGYDESDVADGKGVQLKRLGVDDVALVVTGTDWNTLYDRGLMGPGTIINVENLGVTLTFPLTIHPDAFQNDLSGDVRVLWLDSSPPHPDAPAIVGNVSLPLEYSLELNPDIMPDEEPLELPRGACIDLENSHLPDSWVVGTDATTGKRVYSNRMDVMFSAKGTAVGVAAAAGIIHLHIADVADALEDTLPGSPTTPNDFDGDGNPDERHGNELGLTIFTKSGRTISHPIGTDAAYPATWTSTSYVAGDQVSPSAYNGLVFEAVNGGMVGVVEPAWNVTPGGLTADVGVTWVGLKHNVWKFGLEGEVAR